MRLAESTCAKQASALCTLSHNAAYDKEARDQAFGAQLALQWQVGDVCGEPISDICTLHRQRHPPVPEASDEP